MAEKEATVYIVDVCKSMGEKNSGRNETDLNWCMKYVWDKITTAVRTMSRLLSSLKTKLIQFRWLRAGKRSSRVLWPCDQTVSRCRQALAYPFGKAKLSANP